ncbi:MAG TPA: acyltransferase family protein [Planctomycetota bacterium]|nr:acyltransferase family protein [Planctomycetota bacterium]
MGRSVETPERFHALDAVRAAAMLLGILFHAMCSFAETPVGWAARDRSTSLAVDVLLWGLHAFRMPVFFLMSGFFARLLHERLGPAGFVRHRAKRLLVPFLVALPFVMASLWALWTWGFERQAARPAPPRSLYPGLPPGVGPRTMLTGPGHLWFLYYLLLIQAAAAIVARLGRLGERTDRVVRGLAGSPLLPFVMALPTGATLALMKGFEAETPVSFVPQPAVLAFYAVFFAAGWLLHRQPGLVPRLARHLWLPPIIAALLFPVLGSQLEELVRAGRFASSARRLGSVYLLGTFTWSLVLFFIALFVRWLREPRAWVRWLADASYGAYLIHLPVVILLQILVMDLAWPGPLKYGVVAGGTLAVCLGSYRAFVRYTFLGTALNGKRERPATCPP